MMLKTIRRKITIVQNDPKVIIIKLLQVLSFMIPAKLHLKLIFPLYTGRSLNLKNPKTYNEKLQWLKLNYKRPIMTKMVDKYEAKNLVSELVGEEYVVNNYGVWNSFDDIDFDSLPSQFVLKTTHDQGGIIICKNKSSFDYLSAKKKLNSHLKINYYYRSREWPYKNVPPRILAEEYIEEDNSGELKDYKFFCFDGIVKAMFIATERQSGGEVKFDYFDKDFNHLNFTQSHPMSEKDFERPILYNKMVELAERLSNGLPHVRVDLYNANGKIYVGEFTFYHYGGLVLFNPDEWDYTFGSWIVLDTIE